MSEPRYVRWWLLLAKALKNSLPVTLIVDLGAGHQGAVQVKNIQPDVVVDRLP